MDHSNESGDEDAIQEDNVPITSCEGPYMEGHTLFTPEVREQLAQMTFDDNTDVTLEVGPDKAVHVRSGETSDYCEPPSLAVQVKDSVLKDLLRVLHTACCVADEAEDSDDESSPAVEASGDEQSGEGEEEEEKQQLRGQAGKLKVSEAIAIINSRFTQHGEKVAQLGIDSFYQLAASVNSMIIHMTRTIFSKEKSETTGVRFLCVRRKPGKDNPVVCRCGFRVMRPSKCRSDAFQIVVTTKGHDNHVEGCEPQEDALRNENYHKGILTYDFLDDVLREMVNRRRNDPSLRPKNLRREIDDTFRSMGLGRCPEHYKRRLERLAKMGQYKDLPITLSSVVELHSVQKLIDLLEKEKIPYKVYKNSTNNIEALYYADKSLVRNPHAVDAANMVVHDTSFGVVDPACGYEKLSILATIEKIGRSQVLVTGVSLSDKSDYFDVMLELAKEQYPALFRREKLLVFSDEDRAFIKSTKSVLPNAKTLICQWHKKRNFRKPRKRAGSKKRDAKKMREADEEACSDANSAAS